MRGEAARPFAYGCHGTGAAPPHPLGERRQARGSAHRHRCRGDLAAVRAARAGAARRRPAAARRPARSDSHPAGRAARSAAAAGGSNSARPRPAVARGEDARGAEGGAGEGRRAGGGEAPGEAGSRAATRHRRRSAEGATGRLGRWPGGRGGRSWRRPSPDGVRLRTRLSEAVGAAGDRQRRWVGRVSSRGFVYFGGGRSAQIHLCALDAHKRVSR